MSRVITLSLLGIFLLLGLLGAIDVSWETYTEVSPCPAIGGVRVCYLILTCYSLMIISQFLPTRGGRIIFYSAWAIVFGFALLATVLEMNNGSTCPKSSSGFAMCYLSLIYSTAIGVLFWVKNKYH